MADVTHRDGGVSWDYLPSLRPGSGLSASTSGGGELTNLADLLERVLDTGVVIVGDIQINLLDIELLTIKLRLLVASVQTAREMGIDWWENDPWLSSKSRDQRQLPGSRDA